MNQSNNELFENYYFEKMNAAEVKAFKQRLAADPELKKAFKEFQLTAKLYHFENPMASIKKVEKELEKKGFFEEEFVEAEPPLVTNEETVKPEEPTSPNRKATIVKSIPFYKKPVFGYAAAILFLVSVFYLYQNSKTELELSKMALEINTLNETLEFTKQLVIKGYSPSNEGSPLTLDQKFSLNVDRFNADLVSYNKNLNTNINNQTLQFSEPSMVDEFNKFLMSKENSTDEINTKKDIAYYLLGEYERLNRNEEKAKLYFNKVSDQISPVYNHKYMSMALTLMMLESDPDMVKFHLKKIVDNKSRDTTHVTRASKLINLMPGA